MADVFDEMDSEDGYRIEQTEVGDRLALYFKMEQGGFLFCPPEGPEQAARLVAAWTNPKSRDVGACMRLKLMLDAVCRYFNTGGDWPELRGVLDALVGAIPGGLQFPGYHLQATCVNADGEFEHWFLKDDGSGDGAVWVEGLFVETRPARVERGLDDAGAPGGEAGPSGPEPVQRALGYQPPGPAA